MKKEGMITIIVALIGLIGAIGAAIIGAKWGKENVTVIVQADGKNIVLDDAEIQKMAEENESLKNKVAEYEDKINSMESERSELAEKLGDANGKLDGIPSIEFQNLGLSIDGEEKNINKVKSSVFVNGILYYSKEFVDNLLPSDKAATTKDGMLYVGKIVKEKTNLFDMPVIEKEHYAYFYDSIKDTYGNTYGKSVYWEYGDNFITFNVGRQYSYFKCTVAMREGRNGENSFQVLADGNVIYTSSEITNMTEAFEVDIPINEASTLSVGTIGVSGSNIIISDAVVYNQE